MVTSHPQAARSCTSLPGNLFSLKEDHIYYAYSINFYIGGLCAFLLGCKSLDTNHSMLVTTVKHWVHESCATPHSNRCSRGLMCHSSIHALSRNDSLCVRACVCVTLSVSRCTSGSRSTSSMRTVNRCLWSEISEVKDTLKLSTIISTTHK